MTDLEPLGRFWPASSLEHAAFEQGVTPTALLAVLFPVWSIEVEATVTRGEPYALIDRFVERAIAEGRFATADEVADFLCIDSVVVDRATRFLTAIGHLTRTDDQLVVTELGYRSLAANRRFEITARDRRRLYFAGFTSAPLPRPYYDSATITLLDDSARHELRRKRWSPTYHAIPCDQRHPFDPDAVERLAADSERDHFNLPTNIDELGIVGKPTILWLPLHIIRIVDLDRRVQYLAYSQAGGAPDDDLTPSILASPAPGLADTALEDAATKQAPSRMTAWLERNGLDGTTPDRDGHDTWTVTLPASAFGNNKLPLTRLGSWEVIDGGLLRLWCPDGEMRQRALLARIGAYLDYRPDPNPQHVLDLADRIARQLGLDLTDIPTLHTIATDLDDHTVAARLATLIDTP
jgi:hypothetical protein